MFVYHGTAWFGGKHPHVEHVTLVVDGTRRFEQIQSNGGSAFETVVSGSESFETAVAMFTGATGSSAITRATEQLTGKFVHVPPASLAHVLATTGPFVVLRLIVSDVLAGGLTMSRSGSVLSFSSPAMPFSGQVTVDHGRVEAVTLNLPGIRHEYRYARLDRPVPISLPSPADIVVRDPVTGCIEGISYTCVS